MSNYVQVKGNLGRDPEVRFTGTGKCVANFSIATGDNEWTRVVAWEEWAKLVQEQVKKGSLVVVIGELKTREYTAKNGDQKSVTEVVAKEIRVLGKKPESEVWPAQPAEPMTTTKRKAVQSLMQPASDQDIPF